MKQSSIDILEKHRHHHDTLIRAQYLRFLNITEREELLQVMREEFDPLHNPDMWCGECIAEFVRTLYARYDAWIAAQPKEVVPTDAVGADIPVSPNITNTDVEPEDYVIEKPPVITKANFPKHKRR